MKSPSNSNLCILGLFVFVCAYLHSALTESCWAKDTKFIIEWEHCLRAKAAEAKCVKLSGALSEQCSEADVTDYHFVASVNLLPILTCCWMLSSPQIISDWKKPLEIPILGCPVDHLVRSVKCVIQMASKFLPRWTLLIPLRWAMAEAPF